MDDEHLDVLAIRGGRTHRRPRPTCFRSRHGCGCGRGRLRFFRWLPSTSQDGLMKRLAHALDMVSGTRVASHASLFYVREWHRRRTNWARRCRLRGPGAWRMARDLGQQTPALRLLRSVASTADRGPVAAFIVLCHLCPIEFVPALFEEVPQFVLEAVVHAAQHHVAVG